MQDDIDRKKQVYDLIFKKSKEDRETYYEYKVKGISGTIKVDKDKAKTFEKYTWKINNEGSVVAKMNYENPRKDLNSGMITRILFEEEIKELENRVGDSKITIIVNKDKDKNKGNKDKKGEKKETKIKQHTRNIPRYIIRHKNEDKLDNRKENLEFTTRSEHIKSLKKPEKEKILLPDGRKKDISSIYVIRRWSKSEQKNKITYEIKMVKDGEGIYLMKTGNVIQAIWGALLLRFIFKGEEEQLKTFAKEEGVPEEDIELIRAHLEKYLITKDGTYKESILNILHKINIENGIIIKLKKRLEDKSNLIHKFN